MPYMPPALVTDSTLAAQSVLEAMAELIPDWEPHEGDPETSLAEAFGILGSTVAQFLIDNIAEAYAGYGERVLELERVSAAAALAPSTWTAKDNVGYLIPTGSSAVLTSPLTGQPVEFQTIAPANVPPGSTSVAGVQMQAVDTGPEPNGAIGAATQFEGLSFVTGVTLTAAAAGGEDEETADAYINRLAGRGRRVRSIPITPDDHAAFALDVPGVARAATINWLNPGPHPTPTGPDPYGLLLDEVGHVAVASLDVEGNPVDAVTRDAVVAYLTGDERVLGATVHGLDAATTDLVVVATIRVNRGYDEAATIAAAEGAVQTYFDRAGWRYNPTEPGLWDIPRAIVDRFVRALDVAHVIDGSVPGFETAAPGVQSTVSCAINGAAAVELAGWAPLPNLTDVTVTIAS